MPLNFPSDRELRKHTRRHGVEFGLNETDLAAYLSLARAFCEGTCPVGTDECIRMRDNFVDRFLEVSAEFAVMMPGRTVIITYHILHPFGTPGIPVERTHEFATNREYYEADCLCAG